MSLSDDQSLAAHADWLCTFLKDLLRVTVDILVIITVLYRFGNTVLPLSIFLFHFSLLHLLSDTVFFIFL